MKVPNLKSPYHKTGALYYFGRMLDKIRLHQKNQLPTDYINNLGKGFDGRTLEFLRVEYDALAEKVESGASDEEILEWCYATGRRPSEGDIYVWNEFMRKFGWNDDATPTLHRRLAEGGYQNTVQTIFDYIDLDESQ